MLAATWLTGVTGLAKLVNDPDEWVRRNTAEALGILSVQGQPAVQAEAVDALAQTLADSDEQVRFNSGLSLGRIGAPATAAVPRCKWH